MVNSACNIPLSSYRLLFSFRYLLKSNLAFLPDFRRQKSAYPTAASCLQVFVFPKAAQTPLFHKQP
jgi:hypothetical protein